MYFQNQGGVMKSSTHPLGTLIETDVLVIGSGASGCGAALGAREQGLDVVLLDKASWKVLAVLVAATTTTWPS